MSRPVADDVIAVLAEIRRRFEMSGSNPNLQDLRKDAVGAVAQVELAAQRFSNEVSAENSILDACVRRLGYQEAATFDAAVADWLRGHPGPLHTAVMARVTTHAQRDNLADVLGISNPQHVTPPAQDLEAPPTERVQTTVSRILRDTQLSNRVKALHNYKCQICGYTLQLADGSRYAEGHHVQPLGAPHHGPDVMENIICLCPNHHAACDLATIVLIRHELRSAVGHTVDQRFIDYHNKLYRENSRAEQAVAVDRAAMKVVARVTVP